MLYIVVYLTVWGKLFEVEQVGLNLLQVTIWDTLLFILMLLKATEI